MLKGVYDVLIPACNAFEAFLMADFVIKFWEPKNETCSGLIKGVLIFVLFGILETGLLCRAGDLSITALSFGVLFLFSDRYLKGSRVQHCILLLVMLLLIPLINVNVLQAILLSADMSLEEYANTDNPYYLPGTVCVMGIYCIALWIILKNKERLGVFLSKKYSIVYSLIFGYSILVEGVIFYLLRDNIGLHAYRRGLLAISCGAVGIDLYLVFTMYKISGQQKQEEKMKLLQMQNAYQEQQIREAEHSEERINRMRHDYKNMMSTLESLLRDGRVQEGIDYLQKIDDYYIEGGREYVHTGNSLIDAALNRKTAICAEKGIEFTSCVVGELDKIDGFKVSIILFNLLDNAIEALGKNGSGTIYVELMTRGEYFSCMVKNTITASVLQENRELKTTKPDRERHGYGVDHVRELADGMGGLADFFEEKGHFCAHVMLPLESLYTI